jgi:hypothetical protein
MKRLSLRFGIALVTFSIGLGGVGFWLVNRPLPIVDLPQNPPQCASELEAEIDPIDLRSTWRTKFLSRFREFPLNKLPANVEESYRLIWVPTFHAPTVIRIWRSGETYFIATKRLSRNKNNLMIGDLKIEQTRSLTTDEWHNFVNQVNQSCFWIAPSNIKELAEGDGASYTFEGLSDGQYHFVDRIAPSDQMSEIFKSLFKLTNVEMEYEGYL